MRKLSRPPPDSPQLRPGHRLRCRNKTRAAGAWASRPLPLPQPGRHRDEKALQPPAAHFMGPSPSSARGKLPLRGLLGEGGSKRQRAEGKWKTWWGLSLCAGLALLLVLRFATGFSYLSVTEATLGAAPGLPSLLRQVHPNTEEKNLLFLSPHASQESFFFF